MFNNDTNEMICAYDAIKLYRLNYLSFILGNFEVNFTRTRDLLPPRNE